jgi:hypothetical protein
MRFAGPPPPTPPVTGLLQALRLENELRLTCVRYNGATEQALRALNPVELEAGPLALEDALVSYLGVRGENTFILAELEATPVCGVTRAHRSTLKKWNNCQYLRSDPRLDLDPWQSAPRRGAGNGVRSIYLTIEGRGMGRGGQRCVAGGVNSEGYPQRARLSDSAPCREAR